MSLGSHVTRQVPSSSATSSAPASSAAIISSSSSTGTFEQHDAAPGELPPDGAGLSHRTAHLAEDVADVGAGAIAVVGQHVDQQCDAPRGVPLVGDVVVDPAIALAGAAFDRTVDGIVGHLRRLRLLHGGAQRRVDFDVTTTAASRHLDLTCQLVEQLAALGVGGALLVFDGCPFGMT